MRCGSELNALRFYLCPSLEAAGKFMPCYSLLTCCCYMQDASQAVAAGGTKQLILHTNLVAVRTHVLVQLQSQF